MKTLLFAVLFAAPMAASAQVCNHTIPIHAVSQGVGSFHILSDTTMPYNDGSSFYVCSGVHLTIQGSAGCNYYLEDGASLTILDHDGDNVIAKGNCTIVDESTETLVVTSEATTTISKPNDPFNFVQLTCTNMVFDYQLVGGSAPCNLSLEEATVEKLDVYPNPVLEGQSIQFNESVASVSLMDLSGRVVLNQSALNSDELIVSGVNAGIYLITVRRENGTLATSRLEVR